MQAESTHDLAQSKVELLQISLDQRLAEIPITSSFNKMQILREELYCPSTTVQTRDSVVAKMAALSGKLNLRLDAVNCEFDTGFTQKQCNCSLLFSWFCSFACLLFCSVVIAYHFGIVL